MVLSYNELKAFFENKKKLPSTVGNEYMLVNDVYFSAQIKIQTIEAEIRKNGVNNIKSSRMAVSSKNGLQQLYEMCLDETTHGKGAFASGLLTNFKK